MRGLRPFVAALFTLGAATSLAAAADSTQASEQAVKAAFIPKFARYVEFPPGARPSEDQPYYLCIIGRDTLGPQIDRAAASEVIEGRSVAVRRFATIAPDAVAGCHMAFVAGPNDQATAQMIEGLKRQPTLTITDARVGSARGMIHFAVIDGRVRFSINQGAAAARGITISSRLLALAVEVKP
jgi:hypothetical protein